MQRRVAMRVAMEARKSSAKSAGKAPLEVERMPFGKHRGRPLRSVPRDYLEWVVANIVKFKPLVRSAEVVIAELDWQEGKQPASRERQPTRMSSRPKTAVGCSPAPMGRYADGWGQRENHLTDCLPPWEDDAEEPDELTREYLAIVGST